MGSLTTPPCTEGVRWFVLKSPVTMSHAQIAAFAKVYPANARPVQPINKREVLDSK
jgi:carbonic anhydrase